MKLFTKLTILIIAILLILVAFTYEYTKAPTIGVTIVSFEDCMKAGYPIMESYPRRCKTVDGKTFVEKINEKTTYTNATDDMIVIDTPFPGAVTGKTFSVVGKARGTWFFEASFPIVILDKDGTVLAQGIAQAQADWMTTDFVNFKADIQIPNTYTGAAILIAKKDNPSGMPERDASIAFPFTIEY